jgi:hypothetical protein
MAYLQGTIPAEDRRRVEEWLRDDPANRLGVSVNLPLAQRSKKVKNYKLKTKTR